MPSGGHLLRDTGCRGQLALHVTSADGELVAHSGAPQALSLESEEGWQVSGEGRLKHLGCSCGRGLRSGSCPHKNRQRIHRSRLLILESWAKARLCFQLLPASGAVSQHPRLR